MGNLCLDKTLRTNFALDQAEILSQVVSTFKDDFATKKFDWKDNIFKAMQLLVNVSIEPAA